MAITSLSSLKKLTSKKSTVTTASVTASVYSSVLSVTGQGFINFIKFQTTYTSATITFRLTIDGTVYTSSTVSSSSSSSTYFWGFVDGANGGFTTTATSLATTIPYYKNSFLLEVTSTGNLTSNPITTDIFYTIEQ